jgi:ATP-binding cassette subfamily C protein CydC
VTALRRALAALTVDPRRVALAVLAGTAALGCAIGLTAVSAWLIVRAAQHPPVLALQVAVVATRAFGIGRGVLRYVERLAAHDLALRGVVALRERLYQRLAAADPAVVAGLRRGDLLARVGADVDALAEVVVRGLLPFGVGLLTAAGTVVLLAVLLPAAGAAVAVGLLVAGVLAPWLAARGVARAEHDAAAARAATSAEVLSVLDGLAELTVAGALPLRRHRIRDLDRRLATALDAAARGAARAAGLGTLATTAAAVACLALGLDALRAGAISPEVLAVVALTPLAAAEAVTGLPAAAVALVRARAAARRVVELLDAEPARNEPALIETLVPGATPHLSATALTVGRPGRPVLTGLDLDLPPGTKLVLAGPSGCGKTTLLLTLAGLLPPLAGRLTPAAGTLRHLVRFTAEDAHLFATTLRENLRVARPDACDTDLLDALDQVRLTPWFGTLPDGLDTRLESGGGDVSGGERRRLLLARALLTGAPVLLIDEPAEHLDPVTADVLVRDLLTVPGRTVVIATHRVEGLDAADAVLRLGTDGVDTDGVDEVDNEQMAGTRA